MSVNASFEYYWVCLLCGLEFHGLPDNAPPTKCQRCLGTEFQKNTRIIVPFKDRPRRSKHKKASR